MSRKPDVGVTAGHEAAVASEEPDRGGRPKVHVNVKRKNITLRNEAWAAIDRYWHYREFVSREEAMRWLIDAVCLPVSLWREIDRFARQHDHLLGCSHWDDSDHVPSPSVIRRLIEAGLAVEKARIVAPDAVKKLLDAGADATSTTRSAKAKGGD